MSADESIKSEKAAILDVLVKAGFGVMVLVVFGAYLYTEQKNDHENTLIRRDIDKQRVDLIERLVSAMEQDVQTLREIREDNKKEASQIIQVLEAIRDQNKCSDNGLQPELIEEVSSKIELNKLFSNNLPQVKLHKKLGTMLLHILAL